MKKVQVLDKTFKLYLPEDEIQSIVRRMAADISRDYKGRNPIICPVLTGSFMFAADLMRDLDFDARVSCVRFSSYQGMASTGHVKEILGFEPSTASRSFAMRSSRSASPLSTAASPWRECWNS